MKGQSLETRVKRFEDNIVSLEAELAEFIKKGYSHSAKLARLTLKRMKDQHAQLKAAYDEQCGQKDIVAESRKKG